MQSSIVVTGASTGIGLACVRALIAVDFHVFAGVRRMSDADSLGAEFGEHVTPLLFDVTDELAVREAAREMLVELGCAVGPWSDMVADRATRTERPRIRLPWSREGDQR